MQNPAIYNVTMYQGATFDLNLTWKVNGTPINLTSYSARMQVRSTFDASATALTFTSGSGITLGGTAGTILIEASAATTAGVAIGQYVYDLEMVSAGSAVTRLIQGTFIVDPEVTK
jgi:hypothetical protein